MKILFISDVGTEGGAAHSLVDLTKELTKQGHECIVCTAQKGDYNRTLESNGVKTVVSNYVFAMEPQSPYKWKQPIKNVYRRIERVYKLPKAMKELESYIDIGTIDVIHTNSARVDFGCMIRKKYNKPHIMHIREFGEEDFGCVYYKGKYLSYLNENVDQFISISNAVKKTWIKRGLDGEKIQTIYNGIDYEDIQFSNSDNIDDVIKIVIVGGICEAKGQLTAVRAIDEIIRSGFSKIHLDIVGWNDPSYLAQITNYIKVNKLENHVTIIGVDKDIHKHLKNYNVGLMCSKAEGFGRVTAEYMFAKLAVVASNSGANPEIIENGETGYLYDCTDYHDLARRLLKLFNDMQQISKIGEKGYQKAIDNYTINCNSNDIQRVYAEILDQFEGELK